MKPYGTLLAIFLLTLFIGGGNGDVGGGNGDVGNFCQLSLHNVLKCRSEGKLRGRPPETGKHKGVASQLLSAARQGRMIQRVRIPPRKAGQPPGSESLEAWW